MEEIELKFQLPPSRRPLVMQALKSGQITEQRLQARYFDTAGEHLAGHRMALRLRKEGRRWVQTLKAPTADATRRLEHNAPVTLPAGQKEPVLDLSLHEGTPAGDALQHALKAAAKDEGSGQGAALVSRYGTDVRRVSRVIRAGSSRVEVALDVGWITGGSDRLHVCEVEFELKAGSVGDLVVLAQRWVETYGLWLDTASKAERGWRLAHGEPDAPPAKAKDLSLDPKVAPGQAMRAVVRNCLEQITGNAGPVAAGIHDDDHVHQLRVGIRRLRTALKDLHQPGPAVDPAWEASLRQTFQALGAYRDSKAVADHIEPQLEAAGAPPGPARAAVGRAVTSAASWPKKAVLSSGFQGTMLQLLAFCADKPEDDDTPDATRAASVKASLKQRLGKLARQVTHDGKRFQSLSDEDQHRVRKRLKRLRYLAEFARSLFDRKKVDRYLAALRPAQDTLGAYNDELVALRSYAVSAATDVHAAFAMGWLRARKEVNARQCQLALEDMARVDRFWKKR